MSALDLRAPVLRGPHGGVLTFGAPEPRPDLPKIKRNAYLDFKDDGRVEIVDPRPEYRWDRRVFERWTEDGRTMARWTWESEGLPS